MLEIFPSGDNDVTAFCSSLSYSDNRIRNKKWTDLPVLFWQQNEVRRSVHFFVCFFFFSFWLYFAFLLFVPLFLHSRCWVQSHYLSLMSTFFLIWQEIHSKPQLCWLLYNGDIKALNRIISHSWVDLLTWVHCLIWLSYPRTMCSWGLSQGLLSSLHWFFICLMESCILELIIPWSISPSPTPYPLHWVIQLISGMVSVRGWS